MTSDENIAAIEAAYKVADHDLRVRYSKIGCVLALVLVPVFWGLDWTVYRDYVWSMLNARLLCDAGIAIVLVLLFTRVGRRNIRVLGIMWAIFPGIAIAWMIYATEGAMSPYYAGLNLVMIIVCLLMPWTAAEVIALCALTVSMYLGACIGHQVRLSDAPFRYPILINNMYFIIATALICVTASVLMGRRRFEDFRLRHELDGRNQELAEMDRLKSEFFANISHELRTPLTLILSPVEELLNRRHLDDPMRDSLELMRQNGLRLLKLINDLLDMVRLEGGRTEFARRPVDLATFVPGIVDSVRHLATTKGLRIVADGEGDEPLVVAGDPSCLEKVFLNLLTNAIKFTADGGSITTHWRCENGSAQVQVTDTGIGIPESELPFIFDRFRQVDGSSTREYQGVGLGLSLARELVEKHDGRMTVTSKVGTGTTFRVTLPMVDDVVVNVDDVETERDPMAKMLQEADRAGLAVQKVEGQDLAEVGHGDARVLVVDDEPDMRRFIVSILTDDYRVLQAADGETGLTTARSERPDLMVLDLMLPGMNGLEVCRELKSHDRTKDIKVVLLTAKADEKSKIDALERGADDFLTKPFSSVEIRTRLANLLQTSQLQRDLRHRNDELTQTLKQLRDTEAQLVQSEKMNALGSLAAGLLHEINNPLNYTLTAMQLALESAPRDDEDLMDTLNDIDEAHSRYRHRPACVCVS